MVNVDNILTVMVGEYVTIYSRILIRKKNVKRTFKLIKSYQRYSSLDVMICCFPSQKLSFALILLKLKASKGEGGINVYPTVQFLNFTSIFTLYDSIKNGIFQHYKFYDLSLSKILKLIQMTFLMSKK